MMSAEQRVCTCWKVNKVVWLKKMVFVMGLDMNKPWLRLSSVELNEVLIKKPKNEHNFGVDLAQVWIKDLKYKFR